MFKFFCLIGQLEKKAKTRKNLRSLQKERIEDESEKARMCVSSPLELTVEGEKGRERKGGRDWENESGRAKERERDRARGHASGR